MDYDIFLSYRRADQELARDLVAALEARGVGVWWDQKIDGGVDWRDAIVENLIASDMLVILFSNECNESKQLKKELALADDLDKDVIPVLIEDTKPKGHFLYELAARNWIQIFPNPEEKINDLADRLTSLAEDSPGGLAGTKPEAEQTQESNLVSSETPAQETFAPPPSSYTNIDPNDLEARREALKREEALLKIAEKKAKEEAKQASKSKSKKTAAKKSSKRGNVKTQYRNFLPFKWIDVILMAPIVYFVMQSNGMDIDDIDLTDIPELTELVAFIAIGLAGVGALLFPIRYYMRNLRLKDAAKAYAKSSLALYALLWAAGLTYATIEGEFGEVISVCGGFGLLWLGFGVGAFALYGLMHFQRTIRHFNSNVDKI